MYVWDMSTRLCVHTFTDEGCIVGTRVAVSPDQRYLACGSESGVVNVYAGGTCIPPLSGESRSSPKPLKALMNLTTGIDSLCINPTRLLVYCVLSAVYDGFLSLSLLSPSSSSYLLQRVNAYGISKKKGCIESGKNGVLFFNFVFFL